MRKAVLLLSLSVVQASSESGSIQFREGAAEAGIEFRFVSGSADKLFIIESISGGVALFDYDNDGWLDVYLVNGNTVEEFLEGRRTVRNALYRNQGDGTFRDVTLQAGVPGGSWDMGAVAADVDNDGFQDLFLTGFDRNTLFRNNGDGTFRDITASSGLTDKRWGAGAAFGDYDADGLLDLYVARYVQFDPRHPPPPTPRFCSYRGISVQCGPRGMPGAEDSLYRNLGGGRFLDVSREAGILNGSTYYGLGCVWFDYDDDGDQDIFVANDSCPNFLFRNEGGRFVEVAMATGVALGENGNEQDGMGIAVGDVNRDGRLDLVQTNFSEDNNTLYLNRGSFFTDSSFRWGLGESTWQYLGWGTFFLDADLDGWLDLFIANGHVYPQVDKVQIGTSFRQRDLLFRNEAGRRLVELGRQAGLSQIGKHPRGGGGRPGQRRQTGHGRESHGLVRQPVLERESDKRAALDRIRPDRHSFQPRRGGRPCDGIRGGNPASGRGAKRFQLPLPQRPTASIRNGKSKYRRSGDSLAQRQDADSEGLEARHLQPCKGTSSSLRSDSMAKKGVGLCVVCCFQAR